MPKDQTAEWKDLGKAKKQTRQRLGRWRPSHSGQDQLISFEGSLIRIYEPVIGYVVLGIKLGLGHSVYAGVVGDKISMTRVEALDGALCNNGAAIVTDEDEIRLDDCRGSKIKLLGAA